MSPEEWFRSENLKSKDGKSFELFTREYIKLFSRNAWCWTDPDIPSEYKSRLKFIEEKQHKDIGFDGIYITWDDKIGAFQSKHWMHSRQLSYVDIASTLLCGFVSDAEAPILIFTTAESVSGDVYEHIAENTNMFQWFFWDTLIEDPKSTMAIAAVEAITPSKPIKYTLRKEDQKLDLDLVVDHLIDRAQEGAPTRALFRAYCGYGKTLVMSRICATIYTPENPKIIVIVLPLISILEQAREAFRNYLSNTKYKPLIFGFYSHETFQTIPDNTEVVILTTYKSIDKLVEFVKPDLILLDEVHQANRLTWDCLPENSHWIGFTATPTHGVLTNLPDVLVTRDINSGIEMRKIVDYQLVAFHCLNDELSTNSDSFYAYLINRLFLLDETKKCIVYTNTKNNAQKLKNKLLELGNSYHLSVSLLVAETSQTQRQRIRREYLTAEKAVIINVKICMEGIDLPCTDSIFYATELKSDVSIAQSVGRCLRLSPGKLYGKIFIPVLAEDEELKEWNKDAFNFLISFLTLMGGDQPIEVFGDNITKSKKRKSIKSKKIRHIFSSINRNTDIEQLDLPEDIIERIETRCFNREGTKKQKFSQREIVASILMEEYNDGDKVSSGELFRKFETQIREIGWFGGLTPDRSISRIFTKELKQILDHEQKREVFLIIDRNKLLKFLSKNPTYVQGVSIWDYRHN